MSVVPALFLASLAAGVYLAVPAYGDVIMEPVTQTITEIIITSLEANVSSTESNELSIQNTSVTLNKTTTTLNNITVEPVTQTFLNSVTLLEVTNDTAIPLTTTEIITSLEANVSHAESNEVSTQNTSVTVSKTTSAVPSTLNGSTAHETSFTNATENPAVLYETSTAATAFQSPENETFSEVNGNYTSPAPTSVVPSTSLSADTNSITSSPNVTYLLTNASFLNTTVLPSTLGTNETTNSVSSTAVLQINSTGHEIQGPNSTALNFTSTIMLNFTTQSTLLNVSSSAANTTVTTAVVSGSTTGYDTTNSAFQTTSDSGVTAAPQSTKTQLTSTQIFSTIFPKGKDLTQADLTFGSTTEDNLGKKVGTSSGAAAVISIIVILIVIGLLALFFIWRRRRYLYRRLDDNGVVVSQSSYNNPVYSDF